MRFFMELPKKHHHFFFCKVPLWADLLFLEAILRCVVQGSLHCRLSILQGTRQVSQSILYIFLFVKKKELKKYWYFTMDFKFLICYCRFVIKLYEEGSSSATTTNCPQPCPSPSFVSSLF